MAIAVAIRHSFGNFALDLSFESEGRLTAIFGASGAGKTSLINAVAGLVVPAQARIVVDGRVLTDTAAGIALPPHRRRIGYVFQEGRLFPHLTVARNLNYGRYFAPRGEAVADPAQVIALLGLGHLLARRPDALSGGEKQRVALGRALLSSPRLLLMDEPLAALDQARRAEILPYIERLRDEFRIPILYVSHSVAEVARLASDIVVLAQGRSIAAGPAAAVLERFDLLPAEERDEAGVVLDLEVMHYDATFDVTALQRGGLTITVPGRAGPPGTSVRVRIRARDVMVATAEPENISALNIIAGTVTGLTPAGGAAVDLRIACGEATIPARITRQSVARLGLVPGRAVFAVIKAVAIVAPGL